MTVITSKDKMKEIRTNDPELYITTLERVMKLIPWRCTVCGNYPCINPKGYRWCDKWELDYRFVREEDD